MFWMLMAAIICSNPTYHFGNVKTNKVYSHDFILVNKDEKPIKILSVSTSCACTVAKYPKQILNGKQNVIKVALDTKGLKGFIERNVIVITDDKKNPYLMLKIAAEVE